MDHIGFPLSVAVGSTFVLTWMSIKVSAARKAANVPYPYLYADRQDAEKDKKKHIFNCTQRAHQNTLENYGTFLVLLATASIKYPFYAGVCGSIFWAGRILYTIGYCTGDPSKRQRGAIGYIGFFGLLGMAISTCVSYF